MVPGRHQDGFLAEEARERWDAGDGQAGRPENDMRKGERFA
jgi:hypothetical protein